MRELEPLPVGDEVDGVLADHVAAAQRLDADLLAGPLADHPVAREHQILREIAAERDRAVADLRREAVDLSLAAASRLIEKRLDGETDRKLVLDFLATLDDKR